MLLILVILDGWGINTRKEGNAIALAKTPVYDSLRNEFPHTILDASGESVGLPEGQMGNSEVGHLNIGAGRIYYQSCPRVNQGIADGTFFTNQAFVSAVEQVKKNRSQLHLIGMLSSGNVHSSTAHLYSLLEFCQKNGLAKEVFIHVILDGRDCQYNTGVQFVAELQKKTDGRKCQKFTLTISKLMKSWT